jgi:flagellar assembly protein FliH
VRAGESFRRHFPKEEVDRLTAAAYERGKQDELARAELAAADTLRRIAEAAETLVGGLAEEAHALRAEATSVALACARKVASVAVARFPEDEVIAAIEEAMSVLRDGPRLVVAVAPNQLEAVRGRAEQAAQAFGYPGAIVVRGEPGLRPGDAALVWADGAIAIDREAAFQRLEAAISRRLEETDDDQGDLFAAKEGAR